MKKAKKLTALVLAMMMSLSIMAVTASAYSAEEHAHVCSEEMVQPRGLAMRCDYCTQGMTLLHQTGNNSSGHHSVFACYNEDCPNYGVRVEVDW